MDELPADAAIRDAIRRFLDRVAELPDAPLERVIVYGSAARGQAGEDSDVDLLVIWDGTVLEALDVLVPVTTDILVETGIDLSVHPVPPETYERMRGLRTGFYENLEREGLVVA